MLLLAGTLLLSACGVSNVEAPEAQNDAGQPAMQPAELADQTLDEGEIRAEALPGRLLFVRNGTIWLWEGNQPRPLLGDGSAWQPAWSPDGTRIAYVERGESYSNIMLANASGESLLRLTSNQSRFPPHSHERIFDSMWAFYPAWSPDGDTLAVATQYGPPMPSPSGAVEYNLSLYALPVGGGTRQQLYADNKAHVGQIVYAPDGRSLIYTHASLQSGSSQQLHRLSLDTDTDNPFPGAPPRSYDPAFSPDGTWLAFATRDNDHTDVWVLPGKANSSSSPLPQRLTNVEWARAPAFSPDGRMLAFLAIAPGENGFDLWVSDLSLRPDGMLQANNPRQLTAGMRLDAESGLSWAP
jgi:TolB protein